jgi:hypothetical protein
LAFLNFYTEYKGTFITNLRTRFHMFLLMVPMIHYLSSFVRKPNSDFVQVLCTCSTLYTWPGLFRDIALDLWSMSTGTLFISTEVLCVFLHASRRCLNSTSIGSWPLADKYLIIHYSYSTPCSLETLTIREINQKIKITHNFFKDSYFSKLYYGAPF